MSELTPTNRYLPDVEVSERPSRGPVLRSSLTPAAPDEREGVPFREYLAAFRRYAWLIAAAAVVSVGIAGWRLSRELPRYSSSTAVRLVDSRVKMSGDLEAGAAGNEVTGWYTDPVLSQIQVLKSRAVAGAVVDSLGLRFRPERPDFPYRTVGEVRVNSAAKTGDSVTVHFGERVVTATSRGQTARAAYGQPLDLAGVRATFVERPPFPSARFTVVSRDDAVFTLLGVLDARPREMTNVIDISYVANDPHLAQRVADATAAAFQRQSAESAQQQSRRRRLFVQEQLRSTDSLLVAAQYQLSAFRKSVSAFSPREKFRTAEAGIAELRLQREQLSQEQRIYDQLSRELGAGRDEQIAALAAAPQVSANGGMTSLYNQLVRYQTVRDSLTTGPWSRATTNPEIQRLDSLIETTRARLGGAVQARGTALAAQVRVIDELMAADAGSIAALPDAEAEEQRLGRQVETLQKLVDDLLREQQKARIDEAVEAGQVSIVDNAVVPGGPIGRGGKKRLLFALLIGLMLGGGGALLLDRMNTAIVRREDVETLLHLPTLAIIPRITPDAGGKRGKLALRMPKNALTKRNPTGGEALITVTDLHSATSQAFRKLRTHLIFSSGGDRLRTLVVTSPGASEGKSSITANLAITFAQQNLRVVLLDGDLRRSRLHTLFGTERLPGMSEVLTGQVPLESAIRPTAVEGLHVIPAGTLVPNVSELLGGAAMRALLADLSSRYDLVVIDSPPVLAAADAEILAVQTDAVLTVVRAGQTDRHSAQYAVQQLRAIGAKILGAVLNDPDEKVSGYGRYTYYYDYYSDAKA